MASYKTIPSFAMVNLINPMIYTTEAVRVALLGQKGFINFWLCILAILFFASISLYLGITNLRKRLDFI
jgi:ABC-type polysaccharide/polyol phosphate export permease